MLQQWYDNTTSLLDLHAQWEMARWAKWMLIASIASVLISIAGLFGLFTSLMQTRLAIETSQLSANDARKLGEAQARAYLHALDLKPSQEPSAMVITIKNTGSTPAKSLYIGCEIKLVPDGKIREAVQFEKYDYKQWHALPANTERSFKIKVTRGAQYIEENREFYRNNVVSHEARGRFGNLVIVGKIIWKDVFDEYIETGFVFYTSVIGYGDMKVPAAALPAFSILRRDEIPTAIPVYD